MIDIKSLAAGDRENIESQERNTLTYKEWMNQLRMNFKHKIHLDKDYNIKERHKMVDAFFRTEVQFLMRKYIGKEGNYPFHKKKIEDSLMLCFETVKKARFHTEELISRIIAIQNCENHVNSHSHFYDADGID